MNKTFKTILAIAIGVAAFTSCNDSTKLNNKAASEEAKKAIGTAIQKWVRHTSEGMYTLYFTSDSTGKLVLYENESSTTYHFKYKLVDEDIIVKRRGFNSETYHLSYTVDGNYLVCDNGHNVYVYKKLSK